MKRVFREPLLQFLVLGGLIFIADAWLNGSSTESDDFRIRVTAQHIDALKVAFKTEKQRMPSDAELQLRLQQWLDEQILYQQAKALGLDQRDVIVRRQMVQKMRFLLADATPIPEPDLEDLQAFLNEHAERYGHSPRLSFEQVFLSRGKRGESMGQAVRDMVSHLQRHPEDFQGQGDAFGAGQVITALDETALRNEFGRDFYQRIVGLTDGQWQGPVASNLGLHMLRITQRSGFQPAQLSEVRERLENDWRVDQREQVNAKAMRQLREQFQIEYEVVDGGATG